jgi:GINS complex subunit 2
MRVSGSATTPNISQTQTPRRNYGIASSTGADPFRGRFLVRDGACDRHTTSATRSAGTPRRTRTPPCSSNSIRSPGDNRLTIAKGPLRPLNPPQRSDIPLWLALLLKRQRRANILPPPWLNPHSLSAILDHETEHADTFSPPPRLTPPLSDSTQPVSPPFLPTSTADAAPDALPYHWLELGEMLLEAAADDFEEPDQVRKLLRGLREVRMAKLRSGVEVLDAAGSIKMNGVGGMEVGEGRSFITGVIDGLRYATSWQSAAMKGADTLQEDWSFTRATTQGSRRRGGRKRLSWHRRRLRRRRDGHAMSAPHSKSLAT